MEFNFQVRKLTEKDLPFAQALISQWQEDDGVKNHRLPPAAYLQQLLAKDSFHVWVATVKGQVVGGLSAYEIEMFDEVAREIFLFEIGVTDIYQNKGMATALIQALKTYCRAQGIKVIFVGTSLDNAAARRLYEKTGGDLEVIPWYTYQL